MSKQVNKALLQKYLDSSCTPAELALLREYLQNDDYRVSLHRWLEKDWNEFDNPVKKTATIRRIARVAAAAIVLGIILSTWLLIERSVHSSRNNEWVIFSNPAGKRSLLIMPDSSRIYLGMASTVRYNKNYAVSNRDVMMEGEAYFIVDHRHKYPFNVKSGSLTIRDIGTEFNIRHINGDPEIEVTVSKGIVDVINNLPDGLWPTTRLYKNERLIFNTISRTQITDSVASAESIGGWRNGLLTFKEKTLAQVAEELERYYTIPVVFENEDAKKILITTSLQNATVDEAIEIIAITAGVQMKLRENRIIIR